MLLVLFLLFCPPRDRHFRMHSSAFRSRILDCHNKCKVLPSVDWVHNPLSKPMVHPHMHRLLPATCHLAPLFFFPTTLKEFSSTFFSRLSTKKLPTHVGKFSLRFAIFFFFLCLCVGHENALNPFSRRQTGDSRQERAVKPGEWARKIKFGSCCQTLTNWHVACCNSKWKVVKRCWLARPENVFKHFLAFQLEISLATADTWRGKGRGGVVQRFNFECHVNYKTLGNWTRLKGSARHCKQIFSNTTLPYMNVCAQSFIELVNLLWT